MSSDIEITAENSTNKKNKNNGGRPIGQVWKHFTRGDEKAKGKYEATCNHCDKSWDRGEPCQLEAHLASHCSGAPTEIVREYLMKIISNNNDGNGLNNKNNKKRKLIDQNTLDNFICNTLDKGKIEKINQAWVKAFTICRIPWRIIESPFFIEALKETNPSYEPPTRDLFSGHIFEQQLAKVNQKINEILQQQNNLTLGI